LLFGLSCWAAGAQTGAAPQDPGQPPATAPSGSGAQQNPNSASAPKTQAPQNSEPAQPEATPTGQSPNSQQTKPSATKGARHKKTAPQKAVPPNCSTAPDSVNTTAASPPDATKPPESASNGTGSTTAATPALKPCPPPKKVVRNGGSDEPSIQLVGGENSGQTAQQRSTDQLTAATEENLKKIAQRRLTPGQQDMVSQIKQFMDQSKTALAAGDLERGHNLAMKAHLLSGELIKP